MQKLLGAVGALSHMLKGVWRRASGCFCLFSTTAADHFECLTDEFVDERAEHEDQYWVQGRLRVAQPRHEVTHGWTDGLGHHRDRRNKDEKWGPTHSVDHGQCHQQTGEVVVTRQKVHSAAERFKET